MGRGEGSEFSLHVRAPGPTGQEVNSSLQSIEPTLRLLVLFTRVSVARTFCLLAWRLNPPAQSPLGKRLAEAAGKLFLHFCEPARAEDLDRVLARLCGLEQIACPL